MVLTTTDNEIHIFNRKIYIFSTKNEMNENIANKIMKTHRAMQLEL